MQYRGVKERYFVDYKKVMATTRISRVMEGHRIDGKMKVAVKEIAIDQKTNIDLIMNQAIMLNEMDHPNIIKIYDYCCQNNVFGMYLQLCKFNLGQYQDKQLSKGTVLKYAEQIANAMNYLHSKGILHLDLKPQNILLSYDYNIKITDFGESLRGKDTKLGKDLKATLAYSPPYILDVSQEHQIVKFDEKFDVWSFGVIVYQLHMKQPMFSSPTKVALKRQMKAFQANQDSFLEKVKDPDICGILKLCLRTDKEKRASFHKITSYISKIYAAKSEIPKFMPSFIKVKPTEYLPIPQSAKTEDNKKLSPQQSKIYVTLVLKYKDYMENRIKQVSNFLQKINTENIQENCWPHVISKVHHVLIKICLVAIVNKLHHKLQAITETNEIKLYTPEETVIVLNSLNTLYRTQHINKFFKQIANSYSEWKKQFRVFSEKLVTILVTKQPFKTTYQSFVKKFREDKDIFELLLFDNPERCISILLRSYVVNLEKLEVDIPDLDRLSKDKYNRIARDNLYECSIVCALDRLLPEKSFSDNEIYNCFNELKVLQEEEKSKETMRNILSAMNVGLN